MVALERYDNALLKDYTEAEFDHLNECLDHSWYELQLRCS